MSDPEASGRFISIGMPGSDCCQCGPVINNKSGIAVTGSHIPACSGQCDDPIPLYAGVADGGVCYPYTCCPCPATGTNTVTASLSVAGGGGLSKDITLSSDKSSMCLSAHGAQGNVQCYTSTGPYYGSGVEAEKYGVENFELCAPQGGCSGQYIDATLCCCETPGAQGETEGLQECHTCNYQFTIDWIPLDKPGAVEYCYCPDDGMSEKLVPGDEPGTEGVKVINTEFTLVDGTCDPFYLKYIASGMYWNCDCVQAGDSSTVVLTVIIT